MEESEERGFSEKNIVGSPKGKDHEGMDSPQGSKRSARISGFGNEEIVEANYYSDASSVSRKPNNHGGNNTAQHLDQDRAELLRKLDEIKEQLIRNPNLIDKPKEQDQKPSPFLGPGRHVPGPYFQQYSEPLPFAGPNQMQFYGMHSSTSNSTRMPGYGDSFGFQMQRRPPPHYFPGQSPNHPFFSGQYADIGSDIFESHPQDSVFRPHFPAPPSYFGDVPRSPASYHHERISPFSPHNYNNHGTSNPTLYSSRPRTHKRWQSDVDSEMGLGDFAHQHAPKVVSASGARRCHPVAGGAPFLACHNCFELLHLPRKVLKKQQKLQCGACSEFVSFTIVSKKFVLSSSTNEETKPVSREGDVIKPVADEKSSTTLNSSAHVTRPSGYHSSVDYDNSGYDFHSMDNEPVEASKPHSVQSVYYSSSRDRSEDGKAYDSLKAHEEVERSVPHAVKDAKFTPPLAGSSLEELFEHSTANRAALSYGMENIILGSVNESVIRNSIREDPVTYRTEASFDEYTNTDVSQDSKDERKSEDDRGSSRKASDSVFVNMFKRSFRSQKEEKDKYEYEGKDKYEEKDKYEGKDKYEEVWVNGRLIPEDLVKDAEKLAGPIQSGNYWYDYRAGFWGVMGYPCLGIIMPFIEEFNHRMPDKCAGGDTEVFVNGRELHQRDLDLLARRGLPKDKNRSYIVDISGRVLDGDTGEELDRLGRLAPTVEKVKHGFGMRVPKALSS